MACGTEELNKARGALTNSPLSVLRDLRVEQAGESLVIRGRVRSYYEKQMAQEAIRAVCDDIELHNSVDVD